MERENKRFLILLIVTLFICFLIACKKETERTEVIGFPQSFADLAEKVKPGVLARGWIGVSVQSITPEMAKALGLKEIKGALVVNIFQGGPADSAGIKREDILTSFDGKDIKNMSDLPMVVAETPVGKNVVVKVIRNGKEMDLKIKVGEMTG